MSDKRNVGSAALAGLIGHYGSGDSSDDSGDEKPPNKAPPYSNYSVWSVCIDQTTGCPYYWNQITNEVSWEPPPGYGTNVGNNQYTSSTIPTGQPVKSNVIKNNVSQIKDGSQSLPSSVPTIKSSKKSHSSDEEEKIELITSYYNSDSNSGDENTEENSSKSGIRSILKKPKDSKANETKSILKKAKNIKTNPVLTYGPELPKEFTKSDSPQPAKMTIAAPLFPAFKDKNETQITVESDLKQLTNDIENKSLTPSSNEISKDELVSIPDDKSNLNNFETASDLDKSTTPLETENLEKLMCTQASLLKKLGKLEPSEIKYLNGSTANSPILNSTTHSPIGSPGVADSPASIKKSNALDMDVDDLIAQIEMEQPIDQPLVASDALSSETIHSQDGSGTNKSANITEDSSESKNDNTFKPLFPNASFMQSDISQNGVLDKNDNTESIDINQSDLKNGSEKVVNKYEAIANEEGIENSAFKRKRRIALDIFTNKKMAKSEDALQAITFTSKYTSNDEVVGERKGLGFKNDENSSEAVEEKGVNYLNFKKGEAILFQKGDVLNPSDTKKLDKEDEAKENDDKIEGMDDKKKLIEAKLKFLVQSLPPVPPVQQLYIELQTLWGAMSSGALQSKHMHEWLHTANSTLGRLEASAAPHPWICRFHSDAGCYVYEHADTGQWQWEYPEPEVPPPPPTPPAVKPPSPPPDEPTDMDISTTPPPQMNSDIRSSNDIEPLPPGVEIQLYDPSLQLDSNIQSSSSSINNGEPQKDILCAELDSFYSDIAALEETVPVTNTNVEKATFQPIEKPKAIQSNIKLKDVNAVIVADKEKKKKTKVKTPSTMKNKNVSKLVAKWKKVQESLDD